MSSALLRVHYFSLTLLEAVVQHFESWSCFLLCWTKGFGS